MQQFSYHVAMTDVYRVTSTQKTTASLMSLDDFSTISAFFARKLKPICGDVVTVEASPVSEV